MKLPAALAEARKAIAAVTGAVAIIVSTGALNGTAETLVNTILALASAVVVYLVRNDTPAAALEHLDELTPEIDAVVIATEAEIRAASHPATPASPVVPPVVPYPEPPAGTPIGE